MSMQWQANAPWRSTWDPLHRFIGDIEGLYGTPQQYYPGQTVADINPILQGSLEGMMDASRQQQQLLGPANSAWMSALQVDPLREVELQQTDVASDPNVRRMMQANRRAATRTLNDQIMPELFSGGREVGSTTTGNSRMALAQGVAGERLADSVLDANADVMNAANQLYTQRDLSKYGMDQNQAMSEWQTGMQGRMSALGMLPGMMDAQADPFRMQMGVGDFLRGFERENIDADMARHQFEQMEPWQRAQMYYGMLGPISTSGGVAMAPKQEQGGGSPIAAGLGGAMMGNSVLPGWGALAGGALGVASHYF